MEQPAPSKTFGQELKPAVWILSLSGAVLPAGGGLSIYSQTLRIKKWIYLLAHFINLSAAGATHMYAAL